jgi:hypothetical protein
MSMYPPPAPRRSVTGTVLKVLGVLALVLFVLFLLFGVVLPIVLLQLT